MESQPQNPEFRINPENFHQCTYKVGYGIYIFYSLTINMFKGSSFYCSEIEYYSNHAFLNLKGPSK